ncbi:uncharacterized protein LOC116194122 isoform X1 [Punica granatum]|uniref:Uncharacterized protein LOC116194122 isoform X1 n=2 Tax=Punica granatum TaxID=22663 RepID=A0A6P8CCE2_PUNGR|nr:uncharacterized protein LOC116194122 isoform X1 [Punica granatum]
MAKDKKRSTSCFLSCFGTSEDREPMTGTRSNSDKNKSRCLSLSRVWIKKSGAKTVPVDTTTTIVIAATDDVASEKAEAKRRYDESKSKVRRSKSSEKLTGSKRRTFQAVATAVAASDQRRPRETVFMAQIRSEVSSEHDLVLESRMDHPEPERNVACKLHRGLSFCRKIESIKAGVVGSSQPASPIRQTRPGKISPSASFPAPAAPPHKKPREWTDGVSRSLDSIVGMSIIMVTLIIMVFWGRLCAILCTCSWFYFVPQMRSMGRSYSRDGDEPHPDWNGLDLSSEEYKKKVVLEGFLERDRRSSLRERELVKGSI